jgi:hypothetical protein
MHVKRDGYISGSYLLHPLIKKMRAHLELEKFICRVLVDDDRTREFKLKTDTHKDPIHALRYNSPDAQALTAEMRKKDTDA